MVRIGLPGMEFAIASAEPTSNPHFSHLYISAASSRRVESNKDHHSQLLHLCTGEIYFIQPVSVPFCHAFSSISGYMAWLLLIAFDCYWLTGDKFREPLHWSYLESDLVLWFPSLLLVIDKKYLWLSLTRWGQCRNLHVGVPWYRTPKVISTHFCRLVADSATTILLTTRKVAGSIPN